MTEINENFEQAAITAKSLSVKPDNDTLLQLYALYKQGSGGDVSGQKPGFFDFVATAKYEAWERFKGLSQDEARQQYIDLVQKLGA
ncbi:MAG: acyl-CoA-binding protein [Xanthomonadales bacterium]|nr:acyl-CoA-binding protein [Xanthomonadales bacterium]